ncbi:MAG: Hsp20/alpha crystallin family protein [Actinomycetota bacterium]
MLSPFRGRGFYDLQSEMNRMFDDMFGSFFRGPLATRRQRPEVAEWSPTMDVFGRDGDLVIKAELPGVRQEDVDVTLQNGVLTISGERKAEHEEERAGYYVRERRYGHFHRSMTLPEDVDESRIHATFKDGVLEVTVEGAAAVREPKRIQIEGGTTEGSGS